MSWGAVIVAGGALLGGVVASSGARSAANASAQGDAAAIAEQRRQYDLNRSDLAPYRAAGTGALNTLSANFGTSFQTSPGYNFVRSEGQRDIGNSFAARGGAFSGNALRGLAQFNTGLASQEYGNWWNRGAGLAGIGQTATGQGVMAGQNGANNISNFLSQQGDARASGIQGSANAWSNAFGDASYGLGQWWQNRTPSASSGSGGGGWRAPGSGN
jgi:hypothetical protein